MNQTGAALRIVIVAPESLVPDPDGDDADAIGQAKRSRQLRIGLLEGGYNIVAVLPADMFLPDRIAQIQPDLIIVDAESQARDTLEHVVMATRDERRPIVLFTDDNDTTHMKDAIAAGVTAYVVAGRFQVEQKLRRELADARSQLSDRKLVERAKGLLMKRHGWGEEEAYARLRKTAMDKGLRLADLAQRMIDALDLLG